MSGQEAHSAPANCENCGTPLQGHYCHACGQSVHSPTRHFSHALEEVMESFWHLDGRVFRTLRDLLHPGRIALNYLAGQRARYIAPLRLFIVLSVLTFFVGKLVVHVDSAPIHFGNRAGAEIAKAHTPAEVKEIEQRLLAKLAIEEKEAAKQPGFNPALVTARAEIEGAAASRIADLEAAAKEAAQSATAGASPSSAVDQTAARGEESPRAKDDDLDQNWRFNDRPWDENSNPVDVPLMPGFVDRWVNSKIGRAKENMASMDGHPDRFLQAFLSALPTALFLLMPVFALLLKVAYLGSGRHYLEHIVVALYSHAWLLLFLLAMFLLDAVSHGFSAHWVTYAARLLQIGLGIWTPIYLLVMQHRVYGDHWAVTTLRYLVVGSIYVVLIGWTAAIAMLMGISS